MFSLDKLLVVIVLYKERLEDALPFKAVKNANVNCFVYDNSPFSDTELEDYSFVKYVHDPSNPGVSMAYNKGAEFARAEGKEWLLLFDQDTRLPEGFFMKLLLQMKGASSGLYAMKLFKENTLISPCGYKYKRGFSLKNINEGRNSLKNISFLNSGLLISRELFDKAGGYDESVPLYFSDFIFINRLRTVTNSYTLLSIDLFHSLSSNDMSNLVLFKGRYSLYLKGIKESIKSERKGSFYYYISSLLRAVKLTINLKDAYYLKDYWGKLIK